MRHASQQARNTVRFMYTAPLFLCYLTNMADPMVTVHTQGTAIAIVAAPGWTEQDWERGVPRDLEAQYVGSWDYRVIDNHEVWILDTSTLDRP
jgi:hypothetical protein